MTGTLERPIVDQMVTSPSGSDLSRALKPRLDRLVSMDHVSWMNQLAVDGFSGQDIQKLEDLLGSLIDVRSMEETLVRLLPETIDLGDESQLTTVLKEWSGNIARSEIWPAICHADFPDPIDAIALVIRTMTSIVYSVLALENMKRNPLEEETQLPDPGCIEEGIALAEQGIEEDMYTWPAY